jgi:hypothetical protein
MPLDIPLLLRAVSIYHAYQTKSFAMHNKDSLTGIFLTDNLNNRLKIILSLDIKN